MSELQFYDGAYSGPQIDDAISRVLAPDTAPDAAHTTALISSAAVAQAIQGLAGRSLIDNGYMPNPVNQRGASSITGAGFIVDRWYQRFTSADLETSVTANGITSSNISAIVQSIENKARLVGLPLTASALFASGTLLTASCDAYENDKFFRIRGDNPSQTKYDTNDSGRSNAIIEIRIPSTDALVAAKVEIGSYQTLAHKVGDSWVLNEIPDYTTELLKCQRYLCVIGTSNGRSRLAMPYDSTHAVLYYALAVPMRTSISSTIIDTTTCNMVLRDNATAASSTAKVVTGFSVGNFNSRDSFSLAVSVSETLTAGNPYHAFINSGQIVVSAEL